MNDHMLAAYLDKVGLIHSPQVTLERLIEIHKHQHMAIPFENLDVVDGKVVDITLEGIFDKVVRGKRGGYCFELNGLLNSVLVYLDFEVTRRLARVHLSGTPSGRSHLVNIVSLAGKDWLVDAGFGSNTPRQPLPIVYEQEIKTDIQTFRFIRDDCFGTMLQLKQQNDWIDLYSLDMMHVCSGDIEYGNYYASTGPSSIFCSNIVAVRRTENGANVLLNNRLKVIEKQQTREMLLEGKNIFDQVLNEFFEIEHQVPQEQFERVLALHDVD